MEPNLAPGDAGEHVTSLQERLQHLGYFDGMVDGQYGATTEEAVRRFQEAMGHDQDGLVQEWTWQALEYQQTQLADGSGGGWDGWQGEGGHTADHGAGHGTDLAPDHDSLGGQLSPDGQWRWDGSQWQPVAGPLLGSPGPLHPGDLHLDDPAGIGGAGGAGHPMQLDPGPQVPGVQSSEDWMTLSGFATGSAELTPEHQAALAGLAADVNTHPLILGGFITLTGYADRRGNDADNQALGQRRADAVRDYLQSLVTDDQTRQAIRAYSLGAPADGPAGDQPALRKVELSITRRTYNVDLGVHPTPPVTGTPPVSVTDLLQPLPYTALPPEQHLPGPRREETHLPDWFWHELPPRPPEPSLLNQVSRWLNQTLHTHEIAGVAADVAHAFGFDRARVQHMLDEAFQSGGEAALKALLRQAIEAAAGPPSSAPASPTGPNVNPIPFPTPQAQTPEIPTP
jgi:outer membrane protein OmpA-like peptidoglycan-associated protein